MLLAQICNVAEASLGPLSTVQEFLDRVGKAMLPQEVVCLSTFGLAVFAVFGEVI